MLARSAWTWLVLLIAGWASIVASKSPAAVYEMIYSYHIYNIAWEYEGASQQYIYRLLDPVKDKTLYDNSYQKKGHRGSLADGKMDWKDFCLAWFGKNKLGRDNIPDLDMGDVKGTASALAKVTDLDLVKLRQARGKNIKGLQYNEVIMEWRNMVEGARKAL